MYEAVHAYPDGDATVARQAKTAARHGYDGIVVRTEAAIDVDVADADRVPPAASNDAPPAAPNDAPLAAPNDAPLAAIRSAYDVDVVDGVEIDAADPGMAGSAVRTHRSSRTVVCVVGGDDRMNRYAVEEPRVDVLVRPLRGSGGFNHVLAKAARDNDVHVEFDLGPVLRSTGGRRVRALADLRKLREIVTYYDAPHVVSANAGSQLSLRAPRELVAVAETVGFDPDWVREGLRAWGTVADRNRERRSESFIQPGVRRGRYEEKR